MKKQFQLLKRATLVSLLLGVLVFGVALATTITVDGNPADWPGDPSCTIGNAGCALVSTDPNESGVPDANDIVQVWQTNGNNQVYFRYDTVVSTDYTLGQIVKICLNIPNQGPGQTNITGCTGHATDRLIKVTDYGTGVEARVFNCNAVNCNLFSPTSTGTGAFAIAGTVSEVELSLTSLGLGPSDDGASIGTVVYFDNQDLPPDDNIPDSGSITIIIGTGSPTAVTLETLSVRNTTNMVAIGVAGVLLLGGALILLRSRKPTAE